MLTVPIRSDSDRLATCVSMHVCVCGSPTVLVLGSRRSHKKLADPTYARYSLHIPIRAAIGLGLLIAYG